MTKRKHLVRHMGQHKVHLEGVDIFTGRPHVGLYGCFMKSRNVIIPTIKETTMLVRLKTCTISHLTPHAFSEYVYCTY